MTWVIRANCAGHRPRHGRLKFARQPPRGRAGPGKTARVDLGSGRNVEGPKRERTLAKLHALRAHLSILVAAAALVLGPAPVDAAPKPGVRLRILNVNIFYGGDEIDLASGKWCHRSDGCPENLARMIDAIQAAAPDVVALEEGEHSTRVIADALGFHASERMQIATRYPLIDPPGGDGVYVFAEVAPGRVVALMNVHLPADPYGPYLVRDGATLEEVLALENGLRVPALARQLAALPGLLAQQIPTFLAGDFNSPSHLDWTPAVAAVRSEVRYPVEWPVSFVLTTAGFRDSYREVHADPVAVPGFTWTPGSLEGVANEVHDRIDGVLAAGDAVAVDSSVVGEVGGPDVGIEIVDYPTDHRGVVASFDVVPTVPPIFVAVGSRRVFVGDPLSAAFHAPGRSGERVAIAPAGGGGAEALVALPTGARNPTDGSLVFATGGLAPGVYDALLLDARGSVLSRTRFWLYAVGTEPSVATSKAVYAGGEPIVVSWKAAPGMRWDWLGIFAPGEVDGNPNATTCNASTCGNGRYLLYEYTRTAIEGSTHFGPDSPVGWSTWPLQPGNYEIRLLLDDGYRSLASSSPFKVVNP